MRRHDNWSNLSLANRRTESRYGEQQLKKVGPRKNEDFNLRLLLNMNSFATLTASYLQILPYVKIKHKSFNLIIKLFHFPASK